MDLVQHYIAVKQRLLTVPAEIKRKSPISRPLQLSEEASRALKGLPPVKPPPPACLDPLPEIVIPPRALPTLLRDVAEEHGLTVDDLKSHRRFSRLVVARKVFCYRAVVETNQSCVQIGRAFNRDHSTVLWGVQSYCAMHNLPLPRGMSESCRNKLRGYKASRSGFA